MVEKFLGVKEVEGTVWEFADRDEFKEWFNEAEYYGKEDMRKYGKLYNDSGNARLYFVMLF